MSRVRCILAAMPALGRMRTPTWEPYGLRQRPQQPYMPPGDGQGRQPHSSSRRYGLRRGSTTAGARRQGCRRGVIRANGVCLAERGLLPTECRGFGRAMLRSRPCSGDVVRKTAVDERSASVVSAKPDNQHARRGAGREVMHMRRGEHGHTGARHVPLVAESGAGCGRPGEACPWRTKAPGTAGFSLRSRPGRHDPDWWLRRWCPAPRECRPPTIRWRPPTRRWPCGSGSAHSGRRSRSG